MSLQVLQILQYKIKIRRSRYNTKIQMWENNDKNSYATHTQHSVGQICNDSFYEDIKNISSDPRFKTFLEIGTWNGLGSTKAFIEGFKKRQDADKDFIFYSLECNTDKWSDAVKLYNDSRVHILNEVIWNEEPDNFYEIFPQCLTDSTFKHWNEVDIINMKKCDLFLQRNNLPDVFDVILLDGGEFTTYYEFQLLKNRCSLLMLDDINVDKCKRIVEELQNSPQWKIIKQEPLRNGYLIAKRIY